MFKKFFFLAFLTFCLLGAGGGIAQAANSALNPDVKGDIRDQTDAFKGPSGFGDASVGDIVASGIRAFLGLLGVIFIILIVLGGYKWMTAQGNEEKVNEAKDLIKRAVIGIIIITAAYAITYFVFDVLEGITGGGSGPNAP